MRAHFGSCCLASVFVLASISGATSAQTTWYVDARAQAAGLGTPGSPYSRLQYAIDRSTTLAGDTLLVAPGTYLEKIHLAKPIQVHATGGPRLTFLVMPAGAPGEHVFIGPQMEPELAGNTRLEGFTITGATNGSVSVNLHGGTLERCLVVGNSSGMGVSSIFGTVQSCTISGNASGLSFSTFGETTLADSIVWGNATDILGIGGFGTARYTTFGTNPGGFMLSAGPGNESTDPLFVDAARGIYYLRSTSPCIDTAAPYLPHDPDGTRADRGALPPLHVLRQHRR